MTENSQIVDPNASDATITSLEQRIIQLENQLQKTERSLDEQKHLLYQLNNKIPETSIISPKFLTRAFTIWGHQIVAQLMVGIPFYACLFLATLGSD